MKRFPGFHGGLSQSDIQFGLIIIVFIAISTFTPDFMAFDTNAPTFLLLSVCNIVCFTFLNRQKTDQNKSFILEGFFKSPIGIIYSGFLLVSLLSFTQAINLIESVLQFAKIFTVFAAVLNLTFILAQDFRYARFIILVMTGLLIFDSLSVFYYIHRFITGHINVISDIKTFYANKNILASALFVKLPFALWLFIFETKWLKRIGLITMTLGFTAILFLASRAFYLGLFFVSVVFIVWALIVFVKNRKRSVAWLVSAYSASLVISILAFTIVQKAYYPKVVDNRHTQNIAVQISSINELDTSTKVRLDALKYSWRLIAGNPILGVGSGNWKVAVLKYENQEKPDFKYLYKAHNDFAEVAAETGIIGGLLYIGIFAAMVFNALRHYFRRKNRNRELDGCYFLSGAGITFYSVDAFFNFPADRPEILALFVIFVSTGIACSVYQQKKTVPNLPGTDYHDGNLNWWLRKAILLMLFAMLVVSSIALCMNYVSSKTQRIAYEEIRDEKYDLSSDQIASGFPCIPSLTIWGESVVNIEARYLIHEGKYSEAIEILKADRSNPYDSRRELWLYNAFIEQMQFDSAFHYARVALMLKPNYEQYKRLDFESDSVYSVDEKFLLHYRTLLDNNKTSTRIWLIASNFFIQRDEPEKAYEIIKEASLYFTGDSLIDRQRAFLFHKVFIEPNLDLYQLASELYQKQEYLQATEAITEFIKKVPDYAPAYLIRAFSYYYLNEYDKSIQDANTGLSLNPGNGSLINIRGVCNLALGNEDKACEDFKQAMDRGTQSGKENYEKYCGPA